MFKWPNTPLPGANASELADYAEMQCWKTTRASRTALGQDLGRMDENEYSDGVPVEEEWIVDVGEALMEMQRRREACRGGYPFEVDKSGSFARYNSDAEQNKAIIYNFCFWLLGWTCQNSRAGSMRTLMERSSLRK